MELNFLIHDLWPLITRSNSSDGIALQFVPIIVAWFAAWP